VKANLNLRRVFIATGLTVLVVVYVVLWVQMLASPAQRTGADFIAFYAAGRVAEKAGAGRVYDPALQQAVQQDQVGFTLVPGQVLLYNHAPYLIPLLELVADGNYVTSFQRWALLLLALYAISIWVLADLAGRMGFQRPGVLLMAAGMLTFFPLFVSLLNGQDTAFLVLGSCLWLAGLLSDRDPMAGLGLALTTVRPQITLLLAVPFLFRRRRVFLWFCLGTLCLAITSLVLLGSAGTRAYLATLLTSMGGEAYGMKEEAMVNLIGLMRRLAPSLSTQIVHAVGWVVYLLALAGLCLLWARSKSIAAKQAGLAAALAVLTVPHLHYHDLTLLLVPLIAGILLLREQHLAEKDLVLLPLGLSLILLFSNFTPILKFNLPYLVVVMLILVLYFPDRLSRRSALPVE